RITARDETLRQIRIIDTVMDQVGDERDSSLVGISREHEVIEGTQETHGNAVVVGYPVCFLTGGIIQRQRASVLTLGVNSQMGSACLTPTKRIRAFDLVFFLLFQRPVVGGEGEVGGALQHKELLRLLSNLRDELNARGTCA